ncbi:MAG: hypothetical protein WCF67_01295 [Chitinophagaceae bacterium]
MKQMHEIEKQVEDTLNSLDSLGRAKANPFLYTRVEARLRQNSKSVWEQAVAYISRPSVALAMLCMVILSNAAVMYLGAAPEEIAADQLALTEEYSQTVSSYFDVENPEP